MLLLLLLRGVGFVAAGATWLATNRALLRI
jgi:hypothetical protein